MKAVVAVFYQAAGEVRKASAAGTNTEWLTMKPIQEPDTADRQFDFMTSIWCGATLGCIGAAVVLPFPECQ